MYAVIEVKGRQYIVEKGATIEIDRIIGEKDKELEDIKVLLYKTDNEIKIGKPYLDDIKIQAVIKEEIKKEKIIVFKYKAKKGYHKKQGHRQKMTRLFIADIKAA